METEMETQIIPVPDKTYISQITKKISKIRIFGHKI